jgi:hypothetical protein
VTGRPYTQLLPAGDHAKDEMFLGVVNGRWKWK